MEAKVAIGSQDTLSIELNKMAMIIVQAYRSIRDYRDGHYPNLPYDIRRHVYPLIVTLEDWFLMGPQLMDPLKEKVSVECEKAGLPLNWLAEMPYTVCAIHELEDAIQVMDVVGIETVMAGKVFNPEKQRWTLAAHLQDAFKEEMRKARFLFEEEYNSLGVDALTEE
jgi:hypothetical protein